jgi:hypothetical protein
MPQECNYGQTVSRNANYLRETDGILSAMAFYEKVIKVKADVAAFLINCFPSA